jgi:hypothetical protein
VVDLTERASGIDHHTVTQVGFAIEPELHRHTDALDRADVVDISRVDLTPELSG